MKKQLMMKVVKAATAVSCLALCAQAWGQVSKINAYVDPDVAAVAPGGVVKLHAGFSPDGDATVTGYKWYLNGTEITGATDSNYTATASAAAGGYEIYKVVVAGKGSVVTYTNDITTVTNAVVITDTNGVPVLTNLVVRTLTNSVPVATNSVAMVSSATCTLYVLAVQPQVAQLVFSPRSSYGYVRTVESASESALNGLRSTINNNGIENALIVPAGSNQWFHVGTASVQYDSDSKLYYLEIPIYVDWNTNDTARIGKLSACGLDVGISQYGQKSWTLAVQETQTGDVGAWIMDGTKLAVGGNYYLSPATVGTSWNMIGLMSTCGGYKSGAAQEGSSSYATSLKPAFRDTSGYLAVWTTRSAGDALNAYWPSSDDYMIPAWADTSWSTVVVGPVDANGNTGLYWQSTAGDMGVWNMNGQTMADYGTLTPATVDSSWTLRAAGDTAGNGVTRLIFQSTAGEVGLWTMTGNVGVPTVMGTTATGTWKIVACADADGDGKADIIWQDALGNLGVWYMDGITMKASTSPTLLSPATGSTWRVTGAAGVYAPTPPVVAE